MTDVVTDLHPYASESEQKYKSLLAGIPAGGNLSSLNKTYVRKTTNPPQTFIYTHKKYRFKKVTNARNKNIHPDYSGITIGTECIIRECKVGNYRNYEVFCPKYYFKFLDQKIINEYFEEIR